MDAPPENCKGQRLVLVTGGSGFVGEAVASELRRSGFLVRALVRRPGSTGCSAEVVGDVRNAESLYPAMAGVDSVVHCAGLAHRRAATDSDYFRVNAEGAANVAIAAGRAGVRRFVLVSSVAVRTNDPYGQSKREGEHRVMEACAASGAELVILRMVTLYGERDPGSVAQLIRAVSRGRFVWVGRGENRKSLLYRSDAARACVLALSADPETYNVSASPVTMQEVVQEIVTAVGRPVLALRFPSSAARVLARAASRLAGRQGPLERARETLEKWLREDVFDPEPFEEPSDSKRAWTFATASGAKSPGLSPTRIGSRDGSRRGSGRALLLAFDPDGFESLPALRVAS